MPNTPKCCGLAARDIDDEPKDEYGEVEAVGEGSEVVLGVLGVAEGLVGARHVLWSVVVSPRARLPLRVLHGSKTIALMQL